MMNLTQCRQCDPATSNISVKSEFFTSSERGRDWEKTRPQQRGQWKWGSADPMTQWQQREGEGSLAAYINTNTPRGYSLSLSLSLSTVYRLVSTISTPISVCRKHTNLVVLIIFLIPVLFTRSALMYCTLYLKPVGRGKCDDSDTCLHMLFKFSMIYRGVVIVRPVIHLIRRLEQHCNDQRITDSLRILSTPASSALR